MGNFGVNFAVSIRTVENDLAFLKKIGFINYIGSDKSGKYITTDRFKEFLEENNSFI